MSMAYPAESTGVIKRIATNGHVYSPEIKMHNVELLTDSPICHPTCEH